MPGFVMKENGIKEEFSFEKIKLSVEQAFKKTDGIEEDVKTGMIVQVLGAVSQQLEKDGKKEIKSEDIRDTIILQLKEAGCESVIDTWLKHEVSKPE